MIIDALGSGDLNELHAFDLPAKLDKNKKIATDTHLFEATFLQIMQKSSCIDQHFVDATNPFGSQFSERLPEVVNRTQIIENCEQIPLATRQQPIAVNKPSVATKTDGIHASVDDFVKSIWPYAIQASNLIGLDPKVLMAQAALETGWGRFIANDSDGKSSNNLFNIKSTNANTDEAVFIKTTEYQADKPMTMMASFKKYQSVEQSFNDYVSLIKGSDRYQNALHNAHDPERYVSALHQAGYATDPNYSTKIIAIYHGDELQQALERNGCV